MVRTRNLGQLPLSEHQVAARMAKVHATHSLGTADAFTVVASLPPMKRRPEMRLLFPGYGTHGRDLDRAFCSVLYYPE